MAKSLRKNYIYNAMFQLLTIFTPFITTPYISRVLKADGVGTASFVNSVVQNFLLVAQMGIYAYGRREISYNQNNKEKRSWIFWNLKALALINAALSMTALLVLTYIYARENYYLYLISGMNIINIFLDLGWLYEGLEEFSTLVFRNAIVRIVNIAFILLFVKSKADLPLYIGGGVFFSMACHLATWITLPKYIDRPRLTALRPYHDFKTIWFLFLPSIAAEVYTVLDKIMIGLFTGDASENGYYEFGIRISRIVLALIVSQSAVMIPRIGYLFAQNDMEQIRAYTYKSYSFVWFLGIPVCLGLIGVSNNFVPWFFGPGYMKVAGLIKITAFLVMAISLSSITGAQYLIPTLRHNLFTLTIVIGAAVNFCLNIVLIPMFQSYGAAIASVMAEAAIAISQIYILRKELDFRKIIAPCKNNIIAGIIMLAVLMIIDKKLTSSALNTFIMIPTGAFIYFASLFVLRDKFFIENAQKTLASLAKRFHV